MPNRATLFSATLGEDKKVEAPLGPLYIAAALEDVGWRVDFRDFQLFGGANAFDPTLVVECVKGHEPVLMISCFVDMLPVVIAASAILKSERPDTYIMLGGPGPTAGARELLDIFPQIDAIVLGEGEETIKDWVSSYSRVRGTEPRQIAGMIYREQGKIIEGGPRARILKSETVTRPAYHLVEWAHYSAARIITTRGCPYHCSFCDVAPLWGRRAVYREMADTIDEILLLRDRYGKQDIAIVDDTFVLNRDRVRAFCNLLLDTGIEITWGCFGRINLMSEELIALMARAGCQAIFYGIDSGSPAVLERTIKELDHQSILPTLECSAKYFDTVEASFIWGYPFETYEDFLLTLELAAAASRLAPQVNVQLHMLSPLPSSPMFKSFTGDLLLPDGQDARWLLLPGLLLDARAVVVRKVIERAPKLFPGFYSYPTPDIGKKRIHLQEVLKALHCTVGRTFVEKPIGRLLDAEDVVLQNQLLSEATDPEERIGIGLALGLFRRTRRQRAGNPVSAFSGARGASIVRRRNDIREVGMT